MKKCPYCGKENTGTKCEKCFAEIPSVPNKPAKEKEPETTKEKE